VITPVAATVPEFVAVNDKILPVPDDASPIEELLFIHVYVVPATVPVNDTAVALAPLHTVLVSRTATVGVGFTVILKL